MASFDVLGLPSILSHLQLGTAMEEDPETSVEVCAAEVKASLRANNPARVLFTANQTEPPAGIMEAVCEALEGVAPCHRRKATTFLIDYFARSRVAFTTNDSASIAMEVVRAISLKAIKKWRPSEMLKEQNDATVDKLKVFMYSRSSGGEVVADIPQEASWEEDADAAAYELAEASLELSEAVASRYGFTPTVANFVASTPPR